MDDRIQLDQLLENSELYLIIKTLINILKNSIIIEDLEGNLLFGQSNQDSLQKYPIIAARQTIGWVKGGESAQVLAQLLTYLSNQELLTIVDDLTGIANRRYFNRYLQQEWKRSLREMLPLSLLICDVDYFKLYNDCYGHPIGDRCLEKVAQALGQVPKRPSDLVARYGGEEFAIVLPNTDSFGAQSLAEESCQAVRQLKIPHGRSKINPYVTISIGIATVVPSKTAILDNLIATADLSLYCAKIAGRNRYYPQNYRNPLKNEQELESIMMEPQEEKAKLAQLKAKLAETQARYRENQMMFARSQAMFAQSQVKFFRRD